MWSESGFWERWKASAMVGVGLVGVLVNVAGLVLIHARERRRPRELTVFLTLLKMLALSDLLVVLGCPLLYALPQLWFEYNEHIYPRLLPFLMPVVQMAIMASVYATVAMSLERFGRISIHTLPGLTSIFQEQNFRYCVVSLVVVPVLFYLPRFFEFRCVDETFDLVLDCALVLAANNDTNDGNASNLAHACRDKPQSRISQSLTSVKLESTWLRNHPVYYALYCVLLNTLVMCVVPLASLLYFNLVTIHALRSTRHRASANDNNNDNNNNNDDNDGNNNNNDGEENDDDVERRRFRPGRRLRLLRAHMLTRQLRMTDNGS